MPGQHSTSRAGERGPARPGTPSLLRELNDRAALELLLVVRSLGAIIAGMVDMQFGSFNGSCPPNVCANQQVAMFPAVAPPNPDKDDD